MSINEFTRVNGKSTVVAPASEANSQFWMNTQLCVSTANGEKRWATVRGIPLDAEVSKNQFYAKNVQSIFDTMVEQMRENLAEGEEKVLLDNGLLRIVLFRKSNVVQEVADDVKSMVRNLFA